MRRHTAARTLARSRSSTKGEGEVHMEEMEPLKDAFKLRAQREQEEGIRRTVCRMSRV